MPTMRDADLFFEELTGIRPQPAVPRVTARLPAAVTAPPAAPFSSPAGRTWARELFEIVGRRGAGIGDVVSGPAGDSQWTIVGVPGAATFADDVRHGDLVVTRAREDGRLMAFHIVGLTLELRDLLVNGNIQQDALVLRAKSPAVPDIAEHISEDADSDAENAPTFAVGKPDPRKREFIELPAHVESWVPNEAGSGLVMAQFECKTLASLETVMPGATARIGTSPTPLWQTGASGKLEAALDLLVFFPATSAGGTTLPAGRHPLAIVCMGNHEADDGGVEVFSHHGYSGFSASPPAVATGSYLQEALAERGIISVSVSTNPANKLNLLVETRARLIAAALRRMQQLDRDSSSPYHRRIDFQRVALVGHSRGGDAVVRALRLVPSSVRMRALVQLAPTDMTGLLQGAAPTGLTLPAGFPPVKFLKQPMTVPVANGPRQLIVWGSRDGDVSGKEDVRADVSVNPFRHYDRSAVERAFQFWHGATHNRFNRLWTDAHEDSACLSRTAVEPGGLLSRADQEARTVEMVRGWLLFSLFDETTEAVRFDGRTRTTIAPSLPIAAMWKFGKRLTTIDQFDDTRPDRNTLGGANITPSTGLFDEITLANENAAGAGVTAYQFPHIDRALRFSAAPPTGLTSPVWRTTIPAGSRNFRRFDLLTFRVTKKYDAAELKKGTAATPTVRVRLIGSNSRVAHVETATGPLAARPVVRLIPAGECEGPADLTKVHYETWEVSLAAYTAALGAAGLADVHFVEFELDTDAGQPIYIDTISLVKRP